MRQVLLFLAGVGCGSVTTNEHKDAPVANDTPSVCTIHDTPASCGASCVMCPAGAGREVATCDGTACGLGCVDGAPKCSDGTCSKLLWTFEDGTLDGITPRAPAGLVLAVRTHLGSTALAIDVTNLSEVSFTIPVCVTGNVDLATKTLNATVYYEGGTSNGPQFYVQASVPAPQNGAYLSATAQVAANTPQTFSAPMSSSSNAAATTSVVFQAGTLGQQFSGTIWFDDIKLQ